MPRTLLATTLLIALAGCQATGAGTTRARAPADAHTLAALADALPGDYDNHEQVARVDAHASDAIVPLHVQHTLRAAGRRGDGVDWLWQLRIAGKPEASVWLLREEAAPGATALRIVPYRPIDAAAAKAWFADGAKAFSFEAAQWAELAPCALTGAWEGARFSAQADVEACSALLPGLGEDAALLPLRFALDGEMLHVQVFADRTRGADALEDARRVRWFRGWTALNGAGPKAALVTGDWHLQRDLRLGSEGGRVPLRWRDGNASGYSLELERTSYPERKLSVLQLNVIEDANGKAITYVWADPNANAIGLNLGWLQAGFVLESESAAGKSKQ